MMYRSIVFVHGVVAVVGGLGAALMPGWWLYDRHFGRLFGFDTSLYTQAKSLMMLMGVGYFTAGALLIAALWVRDRRARLGVGLALVAGNVIGSLHALLGLHNFGVHRYSVAFLLLYLLLLLASLVLLFAETVAWASPARAEERPA